MSVIPGGGIVYQVVTHQSVLAAEGGGTQLAGEGLLTAVNQAMSVHTLRRLKELAAVGTGVRGKRRVTQEVSAEMPLTDVHLHKYQTGSEGLELESFQRMKSRNMNLLMQLPVHISVQIRFV